MTVAAIVTLYNRPHNVRRVAEAWMAQTQTPDELWLLTEGRIITEVYKQEWPDWRHIRELPTPRRTDGTYAVVPYAQKINYALDRTACDFIVYGTDDSFPAPEKVGRMSHALDANPDWGVVYCGQSWRSPDGTEGHRGDIGRIDNAFSVIDHTQVMHRLTADRWDLDGEIRLGDALFWRRLHASLGAFYPVADELDRTEQTADGISTSR